MSSDLNTGSFAKLSEILPGQIGTNRRWASADVNTLVSLVAGIVAERVGYAQTNTDLSLVGGQHEYSLPTDFISVTEVLYNEGESDSGVVIPCSLSDLDRINLSWRDDYGSRPQYYTILGTPGSDSCTLLLYPPQASTTGDTVTVYGDGFYEGRVADDLQDRCIVPYVLALLYASEDAGKASLFMNEAEEGIYTVCKQYSDETLEGI